MKQFININEVVANAATIIKGARKEDRNLMKQWAYIGERQLGHSKLNEKVYETTVDELCFAKPLDYALANDLALCDANGTEYKYTYRGKSRGIHQRQDKEYMYNHTIDVYEDDYFFNLGSTGTNIRTAKLRYYAFPVDEDGDLLVPETHMFALMAFIKYMWEYRNEGQMVMLAKQEWEQQAAKARSKNKMPHMLRGKQIAKDYMSMIDKLMPYKD